MTIHFYVNCQAHNQPTEHGAATCRHCALDAAERILIEAIGSFNIHSSNPETPAFKVLLRAQMWVNVQRYSDEARRAFESEEASFKTSKMPALWGTLAEIIDVCLSGNPAVNGNCGEPDCIVCATRVAIDPTKPADAVCIDPSPAERATASHLPDGPSDDERQKCSECGEYKVHCSCVHDDDCVCMDCDPFNFKKNGLV